jgi:hypothetical protein
LIIATFLAKTTRKNSAILEIYLSLSTIYLCVYRA